MHNWRQNTTGSKKRGIFSNAAAATSGQSITERFKCVLEWRWRSQHRNAKKQTRRNIQSDGIDDSMLAAMPKHESFQIYACSVQKIVYPLRIWMKFWQQNLGEVKVCRS